MQIYFFFYSLLKNFLFLYKIKTLFEKFLFVCPNKTYRISTSYNHAIFLKKFLCMFYQFFYKFAIRKIARSSNGRTADFGSVSLGSSPSRATK